MRFILTFLILTCYTARGEDWPQFLGPARNGVYSGVGVEWTKNGPAPGWKPTQIWKKDVGQGFSAVKFDVDHTGTAGLAGLMQLNAPYPPGSDETIAVLFTGITR